MADEVEGEVEEAEGTQFLEQIAFYHDYQAFLRHKGNQNFHCIGRISPEIFHCIGKIGRLSLHCIGKIRPYDTHCIGKRQGASQSRSSKFQAERWQMSSRHGESLDIHPLNLLSPYLPATLPAALPQETSLFHASMQLRDLHSPKKMITFASDKILSVYRDYERYG